MKIHKCKCGENVSLDYTKSARVVAVPSSYYEWICDKCGQVFRVKVKEPIYINE